MAEINFNNLYDQLSPMDKMFYDQRFQKSYNPNQENIMLSSQPAYEQMKSVYDAQQQVPEKSFLDSLNPFTSASAAEMPQVPNLSLGYNMPTFDLGTGKGIINTSSALPFRSMVDMQEAANQDLVSQIIAANQVKANPFVRPNMLDIAGGVVPGNQISQINNQVPFNDFYDSVYEPYDEEKDNEQVDKIPGQFSLKDSLSGMGRKFGLSSLLGLITGNPIIGLLSKGIGALANRAGPALNDFKSASTGAQFFKNLRDRKAREDAAARGAAKQAAAARIESFRNFDRNYGGGGGGGSGGTGSAGRGGASPGSAGRGGSDEMGSF